MDISLDYTYKNAHIELVVEDDIITTAKVFMDGEMVFADDTITDNGKDIVFNQVNKNAVLNYCKEIIDYELTEDGREECTNMALVKR